MVLQGLPFSLEGLEDVHFVTRTPDRSELIAR
jgi:hypothetical protein